MEEVEAAASRTLITRARYDDWLERVRVDGLPELRALARYIRVLGAGDRNLGEATVLAWAEVHSAIAVIDDRVARAAGRARNVEVHGSLWLMFEAYNQGALDQRRVESLINRLVDSEAWFPCSSANAFEWAKRNGLLR